jgi:putative addiction module antidote
MGNALGVVLPKAVIDRLGVDEGDSIQLIEASGGYLLTALDASTARQMEAAGAIMRQERDVLRDLAAGCKTRRG